jgi:hypothetical protein
MVRLEDSLSTLYPWLDSAVLARALIASAALDGLDSVCLRPLTDWIMGGETYRQLVELTTPTATRVFVVKDCIGFAGGSVETMDSWLERRAIVNSIPLATPMLCFRSGSTLVEEYIPESAPPIGMAEDRAHLAVERAVRAVVAAGFRPTSIHDWRWKHSEPVLIDFGSDLGPASHGLADPAVAERYVQQLLRAN